MYQSVADSTEKVRPKFTNHSSNGACLAVMGGARRCVANLLRMRIILLRRHQ